MATEPDWTKSVNIDAAFGAAPLQDKLKQARAAGFDEVELTIGDGGCVAMDIVESACVDLAKQVQSAGLAISGLCLNEPCASGLVSTVAEDREAAIERVTAALDRAASLGTDVLVLGLGATDGSQADQRAVIESAGITTPYDDTCALALDSLLSLRFEAEARAVHLACRNNVYRFLLSPGEMRDLIDRVNSPWCRVCLDLTAGVHYGEAEHWLRGLGHRIVRVRFGEPTLIPRVQIQGNPSTGATAVDWPSVRPALNEIAYTGPLTYCGRIDDVSGFASRFELIVSD